jgi:GAF domain-containing protein
MDEENPVTDTREARINEAFMQATAALMRPYDVVDLLSTLMNTCCDILGVQAGGILIADAVGDLELIASTSEEAAIVETMIVDAGAGPCFDAFTSASIISVGDIDTDARAWPVFRAAALEQGFRATHAVPMRIRGEVVGVMNLLGTDARPLAGRDAEVAQSLADIATLGILHERTFRQPHAITEQLHVALDTRILVEQAKGVIAQYGPPTMTMTEAFTALREYARANDLTLRQVAVDTVAERIAPSAVVAVRG